jgi:O-antigen/teichoic acid export membrane protein
MKPKKTESLGISAVRLTFSKMLALAMTMVCTMMLSRIRTLEEYGTYLQIILVVKLLTVIFHLGLQNSITYFLKRAGSKEEKRNFVSVYYTATTILSIMACALLFITTPLIAKYFHNDLISKFAVTMLLLPWTAIIGESVEMLLVAYNRTSLMMQYRITHSATLLGTVAATWVFRWTFSAYMLLYACTEAVFCIAVYIIASKITEGLQMRFDARLFQRMLAFAVPIGLAGFIWTLDVEIDKLMIANFLGIEDYAVYANASKELPFNVITSSVTTVILPQVVLLFKDKKYDGILKLWKISIELTFIIICFAVVMLEMFAPQVITILYSEKYLSGVGVFRVYSCVLFLRITYFGLILNASGKTNAILYSSIGSLIINIVLNYVLFLLLGMVGPAIATVVSLLSVDVFQLSISCKTLECGFSTVFPWKKMMITALICITVGTIVYIGFCVTCSLIGLNHVLLSILWGFIGLCAYILLRKRKIQTLWKQLNETAI